MKEIVIIGGSQSHVPFIKAAKELGYKTIIFDRDNNCQGAKISDSFYKISTHDIDQIISKCCELHNEKSLSGIMTYSSSKEPLQAIAKTCGILGLPSLSSNSVELATNKNSMKQCFIDNDIFTPKWIETDNLNDAVNFFIEANVTLIVKPSSGSQGSKGVNLIDQQSDISKYIDIAKENSWDSKVILEMYHTGREFSVDGIIVDNKPVILSISEKFNLGPEFNFIMSGFSMMKITIEECEIQKDIALIKETATNAVKAMKISNSFFSADILLTSKGPMVMECGVLLDCKIDRLIYHAGIDVYDLFIKLVTKQKIEIENLRSTENWNLSFLFAPNEGRLNMKSEGINNYDGNIEWEKSNGSHVKPPDSIADTLGWVITKDNNIKIDYNCNSIYEII